MSNRPIGRKRALSGRSVLIAALFLGTILACPPLNHMLLDGKTEKVANLEDSVSQAVSRLSEEIGLLPRQGMSSGEISRERLRRGYLQASEGKTGQMDNENMNQSGDLRHEGPQSHRDQLPIEEKRKLNSYAEATVRYFTSPQANDLDVGFAHAFFGTGKFLVHQNGRWFWEKGTWREESWNLTRGYGSHVNTNEVTLRFVSLAAAYKMDWLGYLPEEERYSQSWCQILLGLKTLRAMQTSGDPKQFYKGHFHRTYLTTIERVGEYDANRKAEEIVRPQKENIQSSDDNGLAMMNLLVLEGMANDPSVNIQDRQEIVRLCKEVCHDIDLRGFLVRDRIVQYIQDDVPSRDSWDRLSSEGQIILASMLVSGQITEKEFYQISKSLKNYPVRWRSFDHGTIEIDKPSYHSAMFLHGLRSIHGMPVTEEEFQGVDFFDTSARPVLEAQLDYSEHYGLKALGTQVMTQSLYGTPIFAMNGNLVQFPGNEKSFIPVPEKSLSRATGPHAWFVPLSRWRHLPEKEVDEIFDWASRYELRFFHTGSDEELGWEASIPWTPDDRTYAWKASDGTLRYTDWGRPYEALNTAYIVLSTFDALNPDAPLASYNAEVEKLKHIARYFDNGTLLPQGMFKGT